MMPGIRNGFVGTLFAGLGLAAGISGANAACALAGTWYFYDMQGRSPTITTSTKSVVVGPAINNKANIQTITGYDNNTATVIMCTMTVKTDGTFTGPCTAYGAHVNTTTISGKLTLSKACALGGTLAVAGDPIPVTIRGGHMNGPSAAAIATQGTLRHHFTLIKH